MSAYRCARCGRRLLTATVQVGSHMVGPVCAKRMGITAPKARRPSKAGRPRNPNLRLSKTRGQFIDVRQADLPLFQTISQPEGAPHV